MKHTIYWTILIIIAGMGPASIYAVPTQIDKHIGRYTIIKAAPLQAEIQPLNALKTLIFPEHIKDVYSALLHLMKQTGYSLSTTSEVEQLLRNLSLPQVHREIGPMTILSALYTLVGASWEIKADNRLRIVEIIDRKSYVKGDADYRHPTESKKNIGSLQDLIVAHYTQISLKDLIAVLMPRGWDVNYEISIDQTMQMLAFHAETTRRRALEKLFLELDLTGIFYPGQGLLLVRPIP